MTNREFDVVIYGATGFTGQLVAEYIAQAHGGGGHFHHDSQGNSIGRTGHLNN